MFDPPFLVNCTFALLPSTVFVFDRDPMACGAVISQLQKQLRRSRVIQGIPEAIVKAGKHHITAVRRGG